MTPSHHHRTVGIALAALMAIGAVGCSGESGNDDTSSQSTTIATTGQASDSAIPTLPPDELDALSDGAVGEPDPALPVDMTPTPFEVGQLASLGNVQIIATEAIWTAGEADAPGRMEIAARLRNASTDTLTVKADAFRLYAASGQSTLPTKATGIVDDPIAADTWVTGQLTFEVPSGQRPVMLVFDGAAYGDRVLSGAIVVGD
jgi:hypothetical protein